MALFHTHNLVLVCANVQDEAHWWIETFDCKEAKPPADWDDPLPSDVALKLPGADRPTILLSDRREVQQAGYDRLNDRSLLFCTNLKKAHEHLRARVATTGAIQEAGGAQFFNLHDPEGNEIEICKDS
jgi:hypothetical protein